MLNSFAPCRLVEHDSKQFSLVFDEIDPYIEFLESHDGQAGGYTWEALVKASLELTNTPLPDVEFDPEGGMFVAVSQNKASLQHVADVIRELATNAEAMEQAIEHAKSEGYFE